MVAEQALVAMGRAVGSILHHFALGQVLCDTFTSKRTCACCCKQECSASSSDGAGAKTCQGVVSGPCVKGELGFGHSLGRTVTLNRNPGSERND